MNIASRGYAKDFKMELKSKFWRFFFKHKLMIKIFKRLYERLPKNKIITDYELLSFNFI